MENLRAKVHLKSDLGRAVLGEFIGTLILVLIGTSAVAQAVLPAPEKTVNQFLSVNIGFALAIAFGVAVTAKLSGGHINPAVSLMFLSFGQLPPLSFILYTLAQTAGAFFGAGLTYAIYHESLTFNNRELLVLPSGKATAGIFASYPEAHLGAFGGLLDQIIATAVFCFLIAHITDKRNSYPTWVQPLIVGLSFLAIGVSFGYNCGFPCNPARDFGPRLFTFLIGYGGGVFSYQSWFWIPIVGPFIGALIGGWVYQFAIGFHVIKDEETRYVIVGKEKTEERKLLNPPGEHVEQA